MGKKRKSEEVVEATLPEEPPKKKAKKEKKAKKGKKEAEISEAAAPAPEPEAPAPKGEKKAKKEKKEKKEKKAKKEKKSKKEPKAEEDAEPAAAAAEGAGKRAPKKKPGAEGGGPVFEVFYRNCRRSATEEEIVGAVEGAVSARMFMKDDEHMGVGILTMTDEDAVNAALEKGETYLEDGTRFYIKPHVAPPSKGTACFVCGKEGHRKDQCPRRGGAGGPSEGGGCAGNWTCRVCGKLGHKGFECPDKPMTDKCFRCGESGHKSFDCPRGAGCFKCGEEGHISVDCPSGGTSGGVSCYICGEEGHKSYKCPQKPQKE